MPALYRTLHLVHSDQRRGAEVFASQLASCMEGNGRFQNAVCALHSGQGESLSVGDLPVFRLEGRPEAFHWAGLDPRLLFRLNGVMRKFQPDIVVAHGSDTLKYAAAASVFYRRAATIYWNIGTASVWANSSLRINLNRMFLRRMDFIVSVSQYTRRDFIKTYHLPQERVIYIPNGVDSDAFDVFGGSVVRAQVRRQLGLSDRDKVLILRAVNR